MISRRLAAVALTLLAFAGCHEDPTVVSVLVGPGSDLLTINARGGNTSAPALVVAAAGTGGDVKAFATGAMNLGSAGSVFAAPAVPVAPATGTELTNAMITAGTPIAGNVLVSSTLQIAAGVFPAAIATNNGDVVILGSLIAERGAGATTNSITISAPAGTIYVLGSIRASGTAGAPDNPNGGSVTLTAARIVLTGSIDTSGELEAAAAGGNGGAVLLDTTAAGGSFISFTSGSIASSGGNGTAAGGNGGAVTLQAGNQLSVFAPITANGGAANDVIPSPPGGNGGAVTLRGNGGADIVAALSMTGGASTGAANGAIGGTGGAFTVGTAAAYRLYGSVTTTGGSASANALGAGALTGGNGGAINLGTVGTPLASLELGRGDYTVSGGQGIGGGGNAGTFDINSIDGDIAVGSSMIARGGDAFAPGVANGGTGGTISIKTDASAAGNLTNHALSIPSLASLLDASGGTPVGGTGGAGNTVTLQCGGDLTCGARIFTSGGMDPTAGTGGTAGAVALLIDAANTVPSGDLVVPGQISAEGGAPTGGTAGNGNTIDLKVFKPGSLGEVRFSGTLSTIGGGNGGGNAALITISAITGNISLAGSITAAGRSGQTAAGAGRNVAVSTAGSITSSAVIISSGGGSLNAAAVVPGADAGNVQFSASSATGSVTMSGGSITASGGAATMTGAGGIGGRVLISTVDQAVSITGSVVAVGGSSPSGLGGLGGQVVVNSDSNGDGIGGAITLNVGSVIKVSGGIGVIGGFARNNGGAAPADSSGTLTLAVVFDASGNLTASIDGVSEGIVRNLGSIIATGGSAAARGGDLWFDGKNSTGIPLTAGDSGTVTLSGSLGSGAFFPN
jgi:hypothetical protein